MRFWKFNWLCWLPARLRHAIYVDVVGEVAAMRATRINNLTVGEASSRFCELHGL